MSREQNIRNKLLRAFDPQTPFSNTTYEFPDQAVTQKLPPQRKSFSINRQSYLNSPEVEAAATTPQKKAQPSQPKQSLSQKKKQFLRIVSNSHERIPRSLVTQRMESHSMQLRSSRRSLREPSQKYVPYQDNRSNTITRANSCILSAYEGELKQQGPSPMPLRERVIITEKIVPVLIKGLDMKTQQAQNRPVHPHLQSKNVKYAPTIHQFDIKQQILTQVGRSNNFKRSAYNPSFIQASQPGFQPNFPIQSQKVLFQVPSPFPFVHTANLGMVYPPSSHICSLKPCPSNASALQTPIRMIANSPEATPRHISLTSSKSMHQIPPYVHNINQKLMVIQDHQRHARQLSLTQTKDKETMKFTPPNGAVPAFRTVSTRQLSSKQQIFHQSQQMLNSQNGMIHSFCPNQQSNPSLQLQTQVKFSYTNSAGQKIEEKKFEESSILRQISHQIAENDKNRREVQGRIEKKLNEISERTNSLNKGHKTVRNLQTNLNQRQSLTLIEQQKHLTIMNRQPLNSKQQRIVAKYEQIIGKENEKQGHLIQKARGQGITRVL